MEWLEFISDDDEANFINNKVDEVTQALFPIKSTYTHIANQIIDLLKLSKIKSIQKIHDSLVIWDTEIKSIIDFNMNSKNNPFFLHIDDLNISTRLKNTLYWLNISLLWDLCIKDACSLLEYNWVWLAQVTEISHLLEIHGLKFWCILVENWKLQKHLYKLSMRFCDLEQLYLLYSKDISKNPLYQTISSLKIWKRLKDHLKRMKIYYLWDLISVNKAKFQVSHITRFTQKNLIELEELLSSLNLKTEQLLPEKWTQLKSIN